VCKEKLTNYFNLTTVLNNNKTNACKMKIEYFGTIKNITGTSSEDIEHIASVGDLLGFLFKKYPKLKNEEFMVMVNRVFVKPEFILNSDDTISLLSIVDGG
jgi:molybdopterin converting factor small subunit